MRVFVTGAGGFIGRSLVRRFRAEGHRVTALLMPEETDPFGGADTARLDLRSAEIPALAAALAGHDAVVHLAGAVGFQTWESCRAVNVEGTRRVAAATAAAGVRRFLHMSSVSVYGRVPNAPITEDSPLRAIGDPYGDTKIQAELLLRERERSGELDLTMLRPTVVYGRGDRKFALNLIDLVRSGKAVLPGDGRNRVDLVHIDDLAELAVSALASREAIGRAYNVAVEDNPSLDELARELARLMGVKLELRYIPFPIAFSAAFLAEQAARITGKAPRLSRYSARVVGRSYSYIAERARRELGFAPRVSLFDGMKDVLEHEGEEA
jgi:nucleoside-diphosphate-sugar epimerase